MKQMKYMAALLLCAGIANASIITPNQVTFSGTYTGPIADAGTSLDNLIGGTESGLSGTPVDDGATAGGVTHTTGNLGDLWVTGAAGVDFLASADGTVQLDFDLGGAHDVKQAYIWGYYYFGDANTPTAIDVSYSTDGSTFSNTESITMALPLAADTPVNAVELNNALVGTTHVRFLFTDNGYDIGTGGDRIGLGEVAFGTIPEPATFGLVAIFGGATLFIRRKLKI